MMASPPADCSEVRCPMCHKYLGTVGRDGSYLRFPPCDCGWQWTGEAVGKRARRSVELPSGERIEVKTPLTLT